MLFGILLVAIMLAVLTRLGLLATVSFWAFAGLCLGFSLTFDYSSWYAGSIAIALLALAGLTLYGFHTSLGGQPLLRGDLLDKGEPRL